MVAIPKLFKNNKQENILLKLLEKRTDKIANDNNNDDDKSELWYNKKNIQ